MNRHLDELCRRVAEPFFVEGRDLLEGRRAKRNALKARRVAMWLAWATWAPRPSTPEIARMFGLRDHSSIIRALQYVEKQIRNGTDVGRLAEQLRNPTPAPHPKLRVVG